MHDTVKALACLGIGVCFCWQVTQGVFSAGGRAQNLRVAIGLVGAVAFIFGGIALAAGV